MTEAFDRNKGRDKGVTASVDSTRSTRAEVTRQEHNAHVAPERNATDPIFWSTERRSAYWELLSVVVHATHEARCWVENCQATAAHAAFDIVNTPISVHGAWEDRTMLALFNWAKERAFPTRDPCAALDPATTMVDPIRIQMRLDSVPSQPVEEFHLPEVNYDALACKAVGFTQPTRDPSDPIDLTDYSLTLKYRDENIRDETWWVRIRDTEHLVRIVDGGARAFGLLRVSASVLNVKPGAAAVVKRVATPKKGPATGAPAEPTDQVPDTPRSASLPTPQKRVATGEANDDRPPKRSSASSILPNATPVNTNERSSASSTLPLVTPSNTPERPSASTTLPSATLATANEGETQQADEKILAALSFFHSLKITSPPRIQIALMSGYKNVKSVGFAKAVSRLRDEGNISCGGGTLSLTNKGRQERPDMRNPPTNNEEVHRRFKTLLTSTCARMFDRLADGKAHKKSDLMTFLNYTNEKSVGFTNSLSSMSELGLITKEYKSGPGGSKTTLIRLTDLAFPFGRPQGPTSEA